MTMCSTITLKPRCFKGSAPTGTGLRDPKGSAHSPLRHWASPPPDADVGGGALRSHWRPYRTKPYFRPYMTLNSRTTKPNVASIPPFGKGVYTMPWMLLGTLTPSSCNRQTRFAPYLP